MKSMLRSVTLLFGLTVLETAVPAPAYGSADPICVFDLMKLRKGDLRKNRDRLEVWDTVHLVASLQGLANRAAPRLWLRFIEPADSYWFDYLREPGNWLAGRPVHHIDTLEKLLAVFRDSYRGVVLYDTRTTAASNIASTIAGVEDLLCVRYDPAEESLYDRIVVGGPRLPVLVDLTWKACGNRPFYEHETGSAKCDPYLWAKRRYLDTGRCNPDHLAYYIDQFWLARPREANAENHTLSNHDYFIANRSFFFDLGPWDDEAPNDDLDQPLGTDHRTLCAILRSACERTRGEKMIHVGGFVPWAWKYCNARVKENRHEPVPTEWRYAEILSCHNAFMDADALGHAAMANASFYQHYPLRERYEQNARPTTETLHARGLLDASGLVAPGRYILFYVGDYDSAAWLCRLMPRCWDDAGRGRVPLAWAFNPNLEMRMAPALVYARETRTPLDFFVAGDSGAGYVNPGHLVPPRRFSGLPSGIDAWRRHCIEYYERWDLDVTGFIIDGYGPPMSDEVLDAYASFSPCGIVAQKIPPYGIHKGMPFIRMGLDLEGSPKAAARRVASGLSEFTPQFMSFRTILQRADWHAHFLEALRTQRPDESIEALDPYSFFLLLAEFVKQRDRYRKPAWPDDHVAYAPGEDPRGLRLLRVADGPFEERRVAGRMATISVADGKTRYLYYAIHDGFLMNERTSVEIEVEYLDQGSGRFGLEYDSQQASYSAPTWVERGGSGEWRIHRFVIDDTRFANSQNGGADFRLLNESGRACFGKASVCKR
jgi:hypothetical protein